MESANTVLSKVLTECWLTYEDKKFSNGNAFVGEHYKFLQILFGLSI